MHSNESHFLAAERRMLSINFFYGPIEVFDHVMGDFYH